MFTYALLVISYGTGRCCYEPQPGFLTRRKNVHSIERPENKMNATAISASFFFWPRK